MDSIARIGIGLVCVFICNRLAVSSSWSCWIGWSCAAIVYVLILPIKERR
jgi:hypothetical protein